MVDIEILSSDEILAILIEKAAKGKDDMTVQSQTCYNYWLDYMSALEWANSALHSSMRRYKRIGID